MDASGANDASGSAPPKRLHEESQDDLDLDNELHRALEEALAEDVPEAPEKPRDTDIVYTYHRMIRAALVDWGDELLDVLVAKFAKIHPKLVAHIEDTRKELIDPLRKSS